MATTITLVRIVRKLTIPSDWPPRPAKLVPTFAVRGCCVAINLGILDWSCYCFLQVAPQLSSQRWVISVPDPLVLRKSGGPVTNGMEVLKFGCPRTAVAEVRWHIGNPEEGDHPPLDSVTRTRDGPWLWTQECVIVTCVRVYNKSRYQSNHVHEDIFKWQRRENPPQDSGLQTLIMSLYEKAK
jgi:hypothetical protein